MSDEWVYLTAKGGRWHRRDDCEALAQGQQEASGRGMTNHPIRGVPQSQVGDRVACGWCVRPGGSPVAVLSDPALKQLRTNTEYERLFLDHVLGSLPELSDWTIESQKEITVAATTYRVDFTVTSGPDRIAIEVDGEIKGDNAPTHDEWTRRQTALVSDGWEVLRFTNRQARDEQEFCRRELAVTVARLRERRRHGPSAPLGASPAPPAMSAPQRKNGSKGGLWTAAAALVAVLAVGGWIASNALQEPGGIDPRERSNGFLFCPDSHPLKGNVNETGEKIVHSPGGGFYDEVKPERCFARVADAEDEGYRASQR